MSGDNGREATVNTGAPSRPARCPHLFKLGNIGGKNVPSGDPGRFSEVFFKRLLSRSRCSELVRTSPKAKIKPRRGKLDPKRAGVQLWAAAGGQETKVGLLWS